MRLVLACVLCAGLAAPAAAQTSEAEHRLDAETAAFVARIAAQADAAGLPGAALRSKALEGASKGADGATIRAAVERLAARLGTARDALGPSSGAELIAAAALLDLGLDADTLRTLRAQGGAANIAGALVGVAFLVQRGVGTARSADLVRGMLAASVDARDFALFQQLVEQDVRAGASAAGAAQARAQAFITHGGRIRVPETP